MKTFILFLFALAAAFGQTLPNAVPLPNPEVQFLNQNGQPLAGGLVYTYAAGTTTPIATYTDSSAATPNANPIVLDSAGRASIWIGAAAIKLGVYDVNSVLQWTQDNISDTTLYFVNYVKAAGTATLISYDPPNSQPQETVAAALTGLTKHYVDPMDYGCVGDGSTDDTACWTAAIASAISLNTPLICPAFTFAVSKQGTTSYAWDGRNHPYIFLITSPISITGPCAFNVDMTDAGTANAFVFQRTQHVRISSLTFNGIGSQSNQILYAGAAVSFVNCNDCYADHIQSYNMRGNTLAFNSVDTGCSHCFSAANPPPANWPTPGSGGYQGAHWAAYGCSGAVFSEDTGYGGTTDGDLSLFGQGTNGAQGNRAVNNHLYNYAYGDTTRTIVYNNAQGFLADSGQSAAVFSGNYGYGYYYCFDVKTEADGTAIVANTSQACKVGIDVRLGENPILTQNTTITGNVVQPLGGNGNSVSFGGLTATVGIWIQDSFGVTVADNLVEASYQVGGNQDFIPILAQLGTTSASLLPFSHGLNIHDNILAMEGQQGASYEYSDNYAIYVAGNSTNSWPGVNVHDNTIKLRTDAAISFPPIFFEYVNNARISANSFIGQVGTPSVYEIVCSSCVAVNVSGNQMSEIGGFLSMANSDQIVVADNILGSQVSYLMPLIHSTASTNWNIHGNIRTQYPYPTNVQNGRFFQSDTSDTTANVIIADNIFYQTVFEADWYQVKGVSFPNTPDLDTLRNVRVGPLNGAMRTYTGITGSLGGSAMLTGACVLDTTLVIVGAHSASGDPPLQVEVSPTNQAGPGAGFYYYAFMVDGGGGTGVVNLELCAAKAGTPTATTYSARIFQ